MRAGLPPPPARVLEVGAGSGELAADPGRRGLRRRRDRPGRRGRRPAGRAPRPRRARRPRSTPRVAVVSLHHVEPFEPSCRRLAAVVRPGGALVVDEFDVDRFDEPSAAWLLDRWRETGQERDRDPADMVAELRAHLHPLDGIRAALGEWFELGPVGARELSLPLVSGRGVPGGRGGADRGRLAAGAGCAVRGDAEAELMRVFRIADSGVRRRPRSRLLRAPARRRGGRHRPDPHLLPLRRGDRRGRRLERTALRAGARPPVLRNRRA